MLEPAPLRIVDFLAADDPLRELPNTTQVQFVRRYLKDRAATATLIEPHYFDRDYLAEFQAFYSTSSRGYRNVCRRLHFFSGDGENRLSRELLIRAAGGEPAAVASVQAAYLGFVVERPLASAPLGRTVLGWYDATPGDRRPPRVTCGRSYVSHVAGLSLSVEGLGWQQQDTGVSDCATVALWTLLQSSAFDDAHAIPTTADLARIAHGSDSPHVLPADGLHVETQCDVLRACGLSPIYVPSDQYEGYEKDVFLGTCATLLRSGYPVILGGVLETDGARKGGHSICVTGFREASSIEPPAGTTSLHDEAVQYLYVHDDNIGPNVRMQIDEVGDPPLVALRLSRPDLRGGADLPDPTLNQPLFIPQEIVAAAHHGLRTRPQALIARAMKISAMLAAGGLDHGITYSARFTRLVDYSGAELAKVLGPGVVLGTVRLALAEQVSPMSLHLGVVRCAVGRAPLVDILYDTTDVDDHLSAFACLVYHSDLWERVRALSHAEYADFRRLIPAF